MTTEQIIAATTELSKSVATVKRCLRVAIDNREYWTQELAQADGIAHRHLATKELAYWTERVRELDSLYHELRDELRAVA